MRTFTIVSPGREIKYLGWNRQMSPLPSTIALIQDEDTVDILALDTPPTIDGILEYISDNPCMALLGLFELRQQPTTDLKPDSQVANCLGVSDSHGQAINDFLASRLSQADYDELMEYLLLGPAVNVTAAPTR